MKNILIYIALGIVATMIATISYLYHSNEKLKVELNNATSNIKAYVAENSALKDNAIAFQLKVDQLNYYNDSLLQKMNDVKKDLNIKDKNIKSLQYMLSKAHRTDTITFRDTLFKEPSLNIDTLIGDEWYQLKLGLKYPNKIITSPSFISEKYVITSYKKETVNPPKKWWILRLFQKKHKVVRVDIVEKNPYIENKQQRFIEIVK